MKCGRAIPWQVYPEVPAIASGEWWSERTGIRQNYVDWCAASLLLGAAHIEANASHALALGSLGVEVDDALEIAEKIDV